MMGHLKQERARLQTGDCQTASEQTVMAEQLAILSFLFRTFCMF